MSNINPWVLLVLGILVGWLLGWLLELWYFRRQRLRCQRESNRLEGQLRARNAELGAANSQISALRGELGTRAKEIDTILYQLAKNEERTDADALEPTPVWKATVEPRPAPEVGTKEITDTDDGAEVPEHMDLSQSSLDTREISPEQWSILRAAGITTVDDLALLNADDLERIFLAPEWQIVDDEAVELQATPPEISHSVSSDDLTLVAGIGPKYAAILQEHGITTLDQLATSDPETLSAMFATSVGRPPDLQSWINQAQAFQAEG